MNKYIKYLKSKGYKIKGNQVMLCGMVFNICSGTLERANGNYKGYWLELK